MPKQRRPILNSPHAPPTHHREFAAPGAPPKHVQGRREAEYATTHPRTKSHDDRGMHISRPPANGIRPPAVQVYPPDFIMTLTGGERIVMEVKEASS